MSSFFLVFLYEHKLRSKLCVGIRRDVQKCVSLACCKDLRNTWHFILANGINRVIGKIAQIIQRPQRSLTERFSFCGPWRKSNAVFDEGDINRLRRRRSMFHYDIDLATTKKKKSFPTMSDSWNLSRVLSNGKR